MRVMRLTAYPEIEIAVEGNACGECPSGDGERKRETVRPPYATNFHERKDL
jgi:hypothetical protein